MHKICSVLVLCLAIAVAPAALAVDPPINFHADGARVHSSLTGNALTLPSQAAASDVVQGFLADRHAGRTLNSLVTSSFERNGVTYVQMSQQFNGLDVYGTYVKAAVNGHGELVHLIENLATPPRGNLAPALVSPDAALAAALVTNHPGHSVGLASVGTAGNTTSFENDGFFWRNPTVTAVAVPLASGGLQAGFLVETWEDESNLLYHTLVDGKGRVLGVQLRTATDSYNIFPDHPGNSTQTVTAGPGAGNAESPIGWLDAGDHSSIFITGNNTQTYLDTDANNAPDAGGATISDGNFVTVANLAQEPEVFSNQEVAVQNLFYLCNLAHDKLYRHGFVEATRNFQQNNFGNGGAAGDPVLCEAQDGSGTNNANFSTPSDGSSGRMQMFVWTQTSPKRDGDLDSDIPWHEYGHGLTWRMIGSMGGSVSGAIGEGMSDVLSILINDNDVVGEYSFNNPNGIRRDPYTDYPRTLGDFTGSSVHSDGEIYAATIWDLWQRFQANTIGQDQLFDYIVDGMNFTPSGPSYEDMRDGIVQSAVNAGLGHECLVWESFAKFGIGVGASIQAKGGGPFGGGSVTVTESFDLPAECGGTGDGGGDGGGTCSDVGQSCKKDTECCTGLTCNGRGNSKTCG